MATIINTVKLIETPAIVLECEHCDWKSWVTQELDAYTAMKGHLSFKPNHVIFMTDAKRVRRSQQIEK